MEENHWLFHDARGPVYSVCLQIKANIFGTLCCVWNSMLDLGGQMNTQHVPIQGGHGETKCLEWLVKGLTSVEQTVFYYGEPFLTEEWFGWAFKGHINIHTHWSDSDRSIPISLFKCCELSKLLFPGPSDWPNHKPVIEKRTIIVYLPVTSGWKSFDSSR